MILLDTDILSLLLAGNLKVREKARKAEEDVAITVITKVGILQARYDFLLKSSDGEQLKRAQFWLERSEHDLEPWEVVKVNAAAATEFDRLRQLRTLKKIGRADLLIAGIVLAQRVTLVSRNLRHFRQIPGLHLENWAD